MRPILVNSTQLATPNDVGSNAAVIFSSHRATLPAAVRTAPARGRSGRRTKKAPLYCVTRKAWSKVARMLDVINQARERSFMLLETARRRPQVPQLVPATHALGRSDFLPRYKPRYGFGSIQKSFFIPSLCGLYRLSESHSSAGPPASGSNGKYRTRGTIRLLCNLYVPDT